MLVQENLLHKMLSDKTQGSDEWQGMTSTQNPSNPLFLICPLKPVGEVGLVPSAVGGQGPGEGTGGNGLPARASVCRGHKDNWAIIVISGG